MNIRKRATLGILAALIAATPVLLAGCGTGVRSIGNESIETLRQKIIVGRSTRADVLNHLGQPNRMGSTGPGQQYWSYTLSGLFGSNIRIITVSFNANGVVDNFTFSGS
jgi:outer membrane protein assembly factor BamE (lipoprotein component of BamABCDE complex)